MLTIMARMGYMARMKQFFIEISSILLYTLILSLSARLYLTGELVTVSDVTLILLCLSRAIVLILCGCDKIKVKYHKQK